MIHHRRIIIEHQILPICTESLDCLSIAIYQIVRVSISRSLPAVHTTLILQDSIVRSACHVTLLPCALPAIGEVVIDLSFTHFTLLSSNEDNTIGGTCTIDSSGCSIFQNLNGFDIIRIHKVKATSNRHTVYDV